MNDEWKMPVYAMRDTHIEVNDRICQFRIMEHQPQIIFEETEKLDGVYCCNKGYCEFRPVAR